MAWALVIRAEDGRHVKSYTTHSMASQAMRDATGYHETLAGVVEDGTMVTDDYGRYITIVKMAKGMTAKVYAALRDAYDARECGTLTDEQRALMAKWGW